MTRTLLTASIVALTFAVPFAQAQTQTPPKKKDEWNRADYEKRFNAADTNHDGGLSMAELGSSKTKYFEHIKSNFAAMDANHDGKVTLAERDAYMKAHPVDKK